jgi:hypothetical protein
MCLCLRPHTWAWASTCTGYADCAFRATAADLPAAAVADNRVTGEELEAKVAERRKQLQEEMERQGGEEATDK